MLKQIKKLRTLVRKVRKEGLNSPDFSTRMTTSREHWKESIIS
jgi:hypothetical protein